MIARFRAALGLREIVAAVAWKPWAHDLEEYERAFAKKMNQEFALGLPYGRTGLMLTFEALGLQNKEIICPAYTCVVVAHAIVLSGNIPVFVDSEESDFNMDLKLAADAITERTGAIIATSIFGYPVNLDQIRSIQNRHPEISVIQDCCHSFDAQWHGSGVHKQGVAAVFAMNISKLMSSIFGGMITTDDPALFEKLRSSRDIRILKPRISKSLRRLAYLIATTLAFHPFFYRIVNKLEQSGLLNRFVKYYNDSTIELPSDAYIGLTKLEARVGLAQLNKLNSIVQHRRAISRIYDEALPSHILKPPQVHGATYSHYVIRVKDRHMVLDQALKQGIQLGQLIEYSIPYMNSYKRFVNSGQTFPVSFELSKTTINLPLWVNTATAKRIASLLSKLES